MKSCILILIFILSSILAFGQLQLKLTTAVPVDSIFFSDITQQQEFQFIPYAAALTINPKDSLNDLYNLSFYTGSGKRMNTLWLNGEQVIVQGKFTGKKLEIDTVIGSTLYYTSLDFRSRFEKLLAKSADSTVINTFLLDEFKQNIDNVFSIEIAQNFFSRNVSRKHELKKLLPLLSAQDPNIKKHLLNPYKKIENILTRNKLELAKFKFYSPEGKLEPLTLATGKRYLIDMWFVGCAPCIEQHQEIANSLTVLKNNTIEIIGISVDQDQDQWKRFLEKKKYNWLNVRETDQYEQRLRTDMLIESYPTYFLIDDEGTILYRSNTFTDMIAFLKLQGSRL